ncbi:MAG TPA: Fe-S protein assembly co-chaperone HscB [Dongiaceae bacterium]|jgi:molecular chaperone HscB|nr:Fe-S protein assembly co-chaperone HscB [Dongiaceae bacterium]
MPTQTDDARAARAGLTRCWSCKGPVASQVLFCHTCGAIQPPGQLDRFRRLGLDPDFDLDLDLVEKRYLGFQRAIHPDRFASKPARERAFAEAQAVALNEAYETLKDPLRRAAYLLGLKGVDAAVSKDETVRDPELLMEAMEAREALTEANSIAKLEKLQAKAGADAIATLSDLSKAFAGDDLREANRLTTRLKYLRKYLDETRARRIALEQPEGSA